MSSLLVLAGSAAVVALMVALAVLLGFRQTARIATEADLAARIAESEPGARLAEAAIDAGGRAALARLSDGRLVGAIVMADGVSLRFVRPEAVRVRLRGARVSARFADVGFPFLNMELSDTPAWLSDLATRGEKT